MPVLNILIVLTGCLKRDKQTELDTCIREQCKLIHEIRMCIPFCLLYVCKCVHVYSHHIILECVFKSGSSLSQVWLKPFWLKHFSRRPPLTIVCACVTIICLTMTDVSASPCLLSSSKLRRLRAAAVKNRLSSVPVMRNRCWEFISTGNDHIVALTTCSLLSHPRLHLYRLQRSCPYHVLQRIPGSKLWAYWPNQILQPRC